MGFTERTENNADNQLPSKSIMVDVNTLEIGTNDMTIGHNSIRVGISYLRTNHISKFQVLSAISFGIFDSSAILKVAKTLKHPLVFEFLDHSNPRT